MKARGVGSSILVMAVLGYGAVVRGAEASPGSSPGSTTTVSALEGTWVAPASTCEQQNAALANAGFTSEDVALAGWDEATCGGMMHGSQMTLDFTGNRLVIYQDGVVGWDGEFQVLDSSTFEAGDTGTLYITYEYAIDSDELTIDMVRDEPPGYSAEELAGELVAQTVIYETAPFARQLSAALPYSLALPEGWVAGAEADSFASADGRITLTIGTGNPEPGQTVEDRVRINREEEFAGCVTDPSQDRNVTVGGEPGILWAFECEGEAGLAANTIHDGLGYRLTMRAPSISAAELEPLMAVVLAGFTFSE